jgi:putative tryptophan/tyrosine transport system substrate-binding protein
MRRRHFILSLPCLAATRVWAQVTARRPKVGILSPGGPGTDATEDGRSLARFFTALNKLGYRDGHNLELVTRFAEGNPERLAGLAVELVQARPNVIYTWSAVGASAAARATNSIPVVVGLASERILTQLARNIARPAGNVTGFVVESRGQYEKCLELLQEILPSVRRVGVLLNPDNPTSQSFLDILEPIASRLGITLVRLESRGRKDIAEVLLGIRARGWMPFCS